ncbi:unnamed protein product [Ectocarpus sp. 6 AP-2014]
MSQRHGCGRVYLSHASCRKSKAPGGGDGTRAPQGKCRPQVDH